MKRSILAVLFVFGVVLSVWSASTGNITLTGVVPKTVNISIVPKPGHNTLDLSAAVVDLHVADVRELSNSLSGYKVTLSSANGGQLKNGGYALPYAAKYNGASIVLSSTPVVITTTSTTTDIVNLLKQFTISYVGGAPETMLAGSYTDNLIFSIEAN